MIRFLFFSSVSENDFIKLDIYNTDPKAIGGKVYFTNADFAEIVSDNAPSDKLKLLLTPLYVGVTVPGEFTNRISPELSLLELKLYTPYSKKVEINIP